MRRLYRRRLSLQRLGFRVRVSGLTLGSQRRVGAVQRVFVTHLHGDHCLGIPAFLAQIAEDTQE